MLQLLEQVTGVSNPNISAWRRQTTGDLTAALGAFPGRRFPRLPGTTAALELAEQQVQKFPLPAIPGANQAFPVVPPGGKPVVSTPARSSAVKGA